MRLTWFKCSECSNEFTEERMIDKGSKLVCKFCDKKLKTEELKAKYPNAYEEREVKELVITP